MKEVKNYWFSAEKTNKTRYAYEKVPTDFFVVIYNPIIATGDFAQEIEPYVLKELDINTADKLIEHLTNKYGDAYSDDNAIFDDENTYVMDTRERTFQFKFCILSKLNNEHIYSSTIDSKCGKCSMLDDIKKQGKDILEVEDYYTYGEKLEALWNIEKLLPALKIIKEKEQNKIAQEEVKEKASEKQQTQKAPQLEQPKWHSIHLNAELVGAEYGKSTRIKMPTGEFSSFSFFVPTKLLREDNISGGMSLAVNDSFKYTLGKGDERVELSCEELCQEMRTQKRMCRTNQSEKQLERGDDDVLE